MAAAVVMTLALAACGGAAHHPLLSARHLAGRIPGCHGFAVMPPSTLATADVSCLVPDGGNGVIDVVTFSDMTSETAWITRQGPWYGCCVEGHLWAATYSSMTADFPLILRALGGREVNG